MPCISVLLKDKKEKNYSSLIGRNFGFGGMDSAGKIIGIAKDFNFNSLHHKIETLCIFNQSDWGFSECFIDDVGSCIIGGLFSEMAAFNKGDLVYIKKIGIYKKLWRS